MPEGWYNRVSLKEVYATGFNYNVFQNTANGATSDDTGAGAGVNYVACGW